MIRSIMSAVVAAVLITPAAPAQVCQTSVQYVQQAVQVQQPYVQQYAAVQAQYPVVVGVPLSDLGVNYYYSVAPDRREARIVEQVTAEVLARMSAGQYGILVPLQPGSQAGAAPGMPAAGPALVPPRPVPPPPVATPAPPVAQPPPTPQPFPAQNTASLTAAPTLRLQVLGLMQAKCMGCHKPGDIKRGIRLINADGSIADHDLGQRIDIVNAVLRKDGVNPMPPTQSLTADEQKLLLGWLNEKL